MACLCLFCEPDLSGPAWGLVYTSSLMMLHLFVCGMNTYSGFCSFTLGNSIPEHRSFDLPLAPRFPPSPIVSSLPTYTNSFPRPYWFGLSFSYYKGWDAKTKSLIISSISFPSLFSTHNFLLCSVIINIMCLAYRGEKYVIKKNSPVSQSLDYWVSLYLGSE